MAKVTKVTNEELNEMAQEAKENWLFDADTDPDGDIQRGLDVLGTNSQDQEVIDARFERGDKWDALMEWAGFLGQR
jgi:hypothetical protein